MDNILEIKNLNVGFQIEDNFYYALNDINLSFEKEKMRINGKMQTARKTLPEPIIKIIISLSTQ